MRVPATVTTTYVPDGYQSTVATIRMMCDLVDKRHIDKRFRSRMRTLAVNLPSMDYRGEIESVWNFIINNVRYLRDPLGAEHITDPLELDREIDSGDGTAMEDCESIALYAATLFASCGIRSAFAIMGKNPTRPDKFTHCFLIVQNPTTKEWVNFDPVGYWTFDGFGLGDSAANAGDPIEYWGLDGRKLDMPFMSRDAFENMSSQDFMGDLLGDLLGDTLADAKKTADGAMGANPWVGIIGGLFQAGEGIVDIATKKAPTASTISIADAKAKAEIEKKAKPSSNPDYLMWGLIGVGGLILAKAVL